MIIQRNILMMRSSIWSLLIIKIIYSKIQHQEFIHKLDEFIEHHNDEIKDQDEQIMGIFLKLISQIAEFVSKM